MTEQLFVGGGEMGALLRSHDWSQTPLGAVETWSDDWKTAVQGLLVELDRAKLLKEQPLNSDLPPGDSAALVLQETAQAHAFRVKLTEALRPLTDPIEIQAIAARILGESLGANRVIYTEVVSGGEEVIVYKNYTNGVVQLSGRYRLEDYQRNLFEDHQAGRTQVVTDIPHHPGYTEAEKARYSAISIAAHIDVPLIKNKQFVALLAVHQATPRQWTAAEVKQVEETAERTWAAVERARAEAALRQSEAILNTINQATPTLICMKDRQGRLRMANPAAIRALGKPESEIIGRTDIEFHLDRHKAEAIMANDRQVMATGQIQMFEEVVASLEGRQTFLSTKSPYLDETGTVIGLIGVSFDITDRKQAETALRDSETKLRLLIEQVPVSVAMFDQQMRYLTVSQRWVDDYHLEAMAAVIGRSHYDLFPDLPDRWRQVHQRCLAGASDKCDEDWFVLPDGSEQWLRWEINPWYDSTGTVGGILLFAENITQRKQAEASLRLSEQRLQLAVKTAKLGSWQLDLQTNALFTSEQCKVNYGVALDADFSHQVLFHRIHPDDRAWVEAAIQQAIAQQSEYDVEYRTVWDDGTIHWALVRGTVTYDADGTPLQMIGMSLDITDRKRAEQALRESEAQSRKILESITDAFFAVNENWRFTYVNQTAEVLLNRTPGDLIGKLLWEAYPGLAGSEFERIFWGAMRDRVAGSVRAFYPDHDRWYEVHTYPGAIGITIYLRNVTDQIQAEAVLRQSEERYRTLFNSIDQGFCVCELIVVDAASDAYDYRILETNPAFETLTGLKQAIGKTGSALIPGLEPFWYETYARVVRTGEPTRFESYLQAWDSWFDVYVTPIDAPQEQKFAVLLSNITERKQIEVALREGANRLQLALASAKLGTWDFNPITGVLQWDKQCKAMFGLSPETEVNYEIFLAGLHPDDREQTDQVVQFALKPESGGEYDLEYRTIGIEDGIERWIAAKGKAFFNPAGSAVRFIGTVLDLTEQKQVEAEREQLLQWEQAAREAAETANRIKDEFLAVLSHELRTPLNPILGWSKLLQKGKLDAARTTMALATIERNAQLQVQLIDDLLDISRILQGKLSLNILPVQLSFVVSAALETVRLAIDAKAIQLHLNIDPEVGQVLGDAARLQQVVWNLLSNAAKFTPDGGQITIALSATDHQAQIQVSDTGKGIKPAFLPYVFEHFRQEDGATTRKFGGLGLGLAIARQIVELHGGQISVDSPGEAQGATFTVQIPLAPSSNQLPSTKSLSAATNDLNGIHILVVDDETDSRDFVAFVLEQAGAHVSSVTSGIEALQVIEQFTPQLIVSDVGMPAMDGYMLLQQVRAIESVKHIPAIALTAYAGEVDRQQATAAGFQQHLSKPVDPEVLVRAIASLVLHN